MLEITLLSGTRLRLGGAPLGLPDKALALVCYLALNPRPHSRDSLLRLLWDASGGEDAGANLRVTLSKLRKELGDYLDIGRQQIRFKAGAPRRLDTEQFAGLVEEGAETEALERALDLYQTEFMADLNLPDSPAFEEWQGLEREKYRQLAQSALYALVGRHVRRGNSGTALEYGARLLALEPWHEETHRLLMELYAREGRYTEALAQFGRCQEMLARELGVGPSQATLRLRARVERARHAPRHNLPAPSAPLVGREAELERLERALGEEDCRLLSVLGPGGIGKTRLALEAARRQVGRFLEGVRWLSLAELASEAALAGELARVLELETSRDVTEDVLNALRFQERLLVFDNAESPEGVTPFVQRLLASAPGVKLLVTSRERLRLAGEVALPLGGLGYPEADLGVGEAFSGVQLFVQQARRAGHEVPGEDMRAVGEVVRLVEGMPLAIELAASWTRALPTGDIARDVRRGLDLLRRAAPHGSARHSSVEQVFDQSWALLGERERALLTATALFAGGFDRTAAETVCGADLATLTSLIDKSLLRRSGGRYSCHPLLEQFYRGKLAALDGERVQVLKDAHSRYYLGTLPVRGAHAVEKDEEDERKGTDVGTELPNLRRACLWAAARGEYASLLRHLPALFDDLERRGRSEEGQALTQALLEHVPSGAAPRLAAYLLVQDARAYHVRGLSDTATDRAAAALELIGRHALGALPEQVAALNVLALAAQYQQGYARARAYLGKALEILGASGNDALRATVLSNLGNLEGDLGEPEAGLRHLEASLELARRLGDLEQVVITLNNLATPLINQGRLAEAETFLQEGLALAEASAYVRTVPYFRNNLGDIALQRGHYEAAKRQYEAATEAAKRTCEYPLEASLYAMQGRACCLLGELDEAETHYLEALRLARRLDLPMLIPGIGSFVAELELRRDRPAEATALIGALGPHRNLLHHSERSLLETLNAELRAKLEEAFEAALASWGELSLSQLEAAMLRRLETPSLPGLQGLE